MKWLSELFKSKQQKSVERILSRHYGGIYKRIDENRELMELLQAKAPEFLAAHPWVNSWLDSTDGFLVDLEKAAPGLDAQFKPKHSETFSFPRSKAA
ncbi:MAG: hypothetical protein PHF20_01360 [Halothiobacillaceae bacterium]|nr:hypothetical protein [Halothiobacillaceae bacterium]